MAQDTKKAVGTSPDAAPGGAAEPPAVPGSQKSAPASPMAPAVPAASKPAAPEIPKPATKVGFPGKDLPSPSAPAGTPTLPFPARDKEAAPAPQPATAKLSFPPPRDLAPKKGPSPLMPLSTPGRIEPLFGAPTSTPPRAMPPPIPLSNGPAVLPAERVETQAPDEEPPAEPPARRVARRRPAGPVRGKIAANDDAPSIGGLIFALDQKPDIKPFKYAAIASAVWAVIGTGFALGNSEKPRSRQGAGLGEILGHPTILLTAAADRRPGRDPVVPCASRLALGGAEASLLHHDRGRDPPRRARPHGRAVGRLARPGGAPPGRLHERRHLAGARPRRRARGAGPQRGVRARALL